MPKGDPDGYKNGEKSHSRNVYDAWVRGQERGLKGASTMDRARVLKELGSEAADEKKNYPQTQKGGKHKKKDNPFYKVNKKD